MGKQSQGGKCMRRVLREDTLVIASYNQGKVKELREYVSPLVKKVYSSEDLGLVEVEESGKTFFANALLKARGAALSSGYVSLSDDSGLVIRGLGGLPGIYSARWASGGDFMKAMVRVHEGLRGCEDCTGYFVCVLCLCWPDGRSESVEGRIEGTIVWPPRGEGGFGYDPIFEPEGYDQTFGELGGEY